MRTVREILLARHQNVVQKLDVIRHKKGGARFCHPVSCAKKNKSKKYLHNQKPL